MNLDHAGVQPLLDEYVDGALSAAERGSVEHHLRACGECKAEVDDLLALRIRARDLPREITPHRDLWPGIQARISAEPAQRAASPGRPVGAAADAIDLVSWRHWKIRWSTGVVRAAAVLALVAISSGVTAYLVRGRDGPGAGGPGGTAEPIAFGPEVRRPVPAAVDPGAVAAAPASTAPAARPAPATGQLRLAGAANNSRDLAAFRAGTEGFDGAVEELRMAFESQRGALDPETVRVIEQNLAIIDTAIAQSRAALDRDPNDPELPLLLSGVYRRKLELLQDAVRLQSRS